MAANTSTNSLPHRLVNDDGIETTECGILDDSFQFSIASAPVTPVSSMFFQQTALSPALQQSSIPGSVEMGNISSSHSESDTSATRPPPNTFVCLDRSKTSSPHIDGTSPFEAPKYAQNLSTEYEYTSFADSLVDVSVIEKEETLEYTMEEFDGVLKSAPSDERDKKIDYDELHEFLDYSGSCSRDNIDQDDEKCSNYSELGYHNSTSRDDRRVDIVAMDRLSQHWSEKLLFDDTPQACMYVFDGMLDYLDLQGPTCIQRSPSDDKSDISLSSRSIHSSRKAPDGNTVKTKDSYFDDHFCCDIETGKEIQVLEVLHPMDSGLSTNYGEYMCGCFEISNMNRNTETLPLNRHKRHILAQTNEHQRFSDRNGSLKGLSTIDELDDEEEDCKFSNRPGRLDSEDSPVFGDLDFNLQWNEEEFKKEAAACKAQDTTLETADESTSMSYSTFSC